MNVDFPGHVCDFAELRHGSVFLMNFSKYGIVFAIKVIVQHASGRRTDHFVILGPFTEGAQGVPELYDPAQLAGDPVLALEGECRFAPSLNPADMLPNPQPDESPGVVLFDRDHVFLGTRVVRDRRTVYVQPETGEVVFQLGNSDLFATKRWSLITAKDKTRTLLDYTAPQGAKQ